MICSYIDCSSMTVDWNFINNQQYKTYLKSSNFIIFVPNRQLIVVIKCHPLLSQPNQQPKITRHNNLSCYHRQKDTKPLWLCCMASTTFSHRKLVCKHLNVHGKLSKYLLHWLWIVTLLWTVPNTNRLINYHPESGWIWFY